MTIYHRSLTSPPFSSFPLSSLDGCRKLGVVTLDSCGEMQYDKESMKDDRLASLLLKHFGIPVLSSNEDGRYY